MKKENNNVKKNKWFFLQVHRIINVLTPVGFDSKKNRKNNVIKDPKCYPLIKPLWGPRRIPRCLGMSLRKRKCGRKDDAHLQTLGIKPERKLCSLHTHHSGSDNRNSQRLLITSSSRKPSGDHLLPLGLKDWSIT